jgi:glycosyltransferase involved in cell wall biosynthesis
MAERLRVLQIVSSSQNSGAERHTLLLSRTLLARGHEVTIACPPTGWLPDKCREEGVRTHLIEMRALGAASRLFHLAARERYHIVHAHLTRAAYQGALVALLRRIPIVATVHIFSRDFVYRWISRQGRLIAVSESARNSLLDVGIPPGAVDLVYNGTDFLDGECTASRDDVLHEFGLGACRLVGLVGRVAKEKGHLIALGAAHRVEQTHPDVHFVFVGRVEPRFEEEFNEALRSRPANGLVTVTGARDDVPRLMDAMEIVLLPSEKETFGLVAIEAMARGKPVVATRVGGLPEIVRDGETGLLIDQDEASLADAIRCLLDDPVRATQMGSAGRAWVRERFGHEQMTDSVEAIYRSVLTHGRPHLKAVPP